MVQVGGKCSLNVFFSGDGALGMAELSDLRLSVNAGNVSADPMFYTSHFRFIPGPLASCQHRTFSRWKEYW